MKAVLERLDDNTLQLTLDDSHVILIRGNYGEGCGVELNDEDFNSQEIFEVIEREI